MLPLRHNSVPSHQSRFSLVSSSYCSVLNVGDINNTLWILHKWGHIVLVFLGLTYLIWHSHFQFYLCHKCHNFSCLWVKKYPTVYLYCIYIVYVFIMEGTMASLCISRFLRIVLDLTWKWGCLTILLLLSLAICEVTELRTSSVFCFWGTSAFFPSSLYYLYSHQQWMGSHFLHITQCLLYLVFFFYSNHPCKSEVLCAYELPWWFFYNEPLSLYCWSFDRLLRNTW